MNETSGTNGCSIILIYKILIVSGNLLAETDARLSSHMFLKLRGALVIQCDLDALYCGTLKVKFVVGKPFDKVLLLILDM